MWWRLFVRHTLRTERTFGLKEPKDKKMKKTEKRFMEQQRLGAQSPRGCMLERKGFQVDIKTDKPRVREQK